MRIRLHRGSLQESLESVEIIAPTRQAIVAYLARRWSLGQPLITAERLEVKPYTDDPRIGWQTHLISFPEVGVLAFTDGPLEEDT